MTLFFSLENLEAESGSDPYKFLLYLRNFYYKRPPKSAHQIPRRNLSGNSFILNPKPILADRPITDVEFIVQYVKLAARRDYTYYKHFGIKTLPLSYFPDINYNAIKYNPLFKIENNQLFFYYEEHTRK
jgi:hypothetical protein